MPLNDEVKKLAESKPFYAVAGAGDYAVQKLRELPEHLHRLQSRRSDAARDLPAKAKKYAGDVQVKAESVAKDLPEKAKSYADTIGSKAALLYDEFADRGRKVVSKVTGEAALELEQVSSSAETARAGRPAQKGRTGTRSTGGRS